MNGLVIEQLFCRRNDVELLNGLTCRVEPGEIVGILAPLVRSTTLLRVIRGSELSDSGSIRWMGREISHLPMFQRIGCGVVGLSSESSLIPTQTVQENLRMVLAGIGKKAREADHYLEEEGVASLRDRRCGDLNSEERYVIERIRALLLSPGLLLVEHPQQELSDERVQSWRRIAKKGVTLLIVTPRVERVVSRVIEL